MLPPAIAPARAAASSLRRPSSSANLRSASQSCGLAGTGRLRSASATVGTDTTLETFPFPAGLAPNVPAADYEGDPRAAAITEASRRLVDLRDRWINPPKWVDWGRRAGSWISVASRSS